VQPGPDQLKAAHREIGRGHIEGPANVLDQQAAENVSQLVVLVVDDVGNLHR